LRIRGLWVRYRGSRDWVLKDISLELDRGLILVVGRTGCGKSTLARCIAGLIPKFFPAEIRGEIDVLGINPMVDGVEALAGKIAYLAQNPEMFIVSPSVLEEIVFPICNLGLPREEILDRLKRVVRELEIKELLKQSTLALSTGQLQMVSIASALATGAKVLVLDEPLARLDPNNAYVVANLLRKIADKNRLVIVFEHHLDYIFELADEVAVLEDGKIKLRGKPREVIDRITDVDIPEIAEIFHGLYLAKCIRSIPISVEDAVRLVINHVKGRKHMV